jgi:hypothetical protein
VLTVQAYPKTVLESRLERIDLSSYRQVNQSYGTPVATISVYSGVDASPSSVLGTPIVSSDTLQVPESGGVAGTIYQINVSVPLTSPSETLSIVYFLAVVPNQQ